MIPLVIPLFFGILMAFYFLIKFYYLKNVYVYVQFNQRKTIHPEFSDPNEMKEVQRIIQIIKARRESHTSLNKLCSSSSLDDLSEVIDKEPRSDLKSNQYDLIELNDTFTRDHIPDLNKWLESTSNKVPSRESTEFTEIDLDQDTADKTVELNTENRIEQSIKYLNLNCDQLNGKQLQILTSLSYLVNEERLSVLVCKLKLPLFKNLNQQFYRRSKLSTNQNYFKTIQQLELIRQTKYIFVKIYLIDSNRKRISKKKTSILPVDGQNTIHNNNPYDQNRYIIINEMMIFNLPIDQLSKITIRLSVLGFSSFNNLKLQMTDRGDLKRKKIKKSIDTFYSFGHVEIGCNSISKSAFLHYQNLLNNLRKPVCSWHQITR